ncbi:MAG TPA: hypothetical protein VNH22_00020 [Blastocatellia bacterium]|jgi:hypothetical protein|nr:hypothetical protein [Blastocatellia bacterium]
MRINVNLSRQPFANRRIFWTGIAIFFLASLWLWLAVIADKTQVSARAYDLDRRIKEQEAQVELLRAEQERNKKVEAPVVLTEQDQLQLVSARQILARKAFSWNRLISHIESYVPNNSRIVSIGVNEVATTDDAIFATIQVKALGQNPGQMTEMMGNLERSGGLFTILQTSQEAVDEGGLVPFTIELTYNATRGGQ